MRNLAVCYLLLISYLVPAVVRAAELPQQWQDYAQPKRGPQQRYSQATELALTSRLESLIADETTPPNTIESYLEKLVAICAFEKRFDVADDYCKHALRFVEKQNDAEQMKARLHATMGNLYYCEHKFTQAELEYAKALQLLPSGEETQDMRAKFSLGLAQVLAEQHRFDEAAQLFEKNYSDANPDPAVLVAFSKCLADKGDLEKSAQKLGRALDLDRAWRGKDDAVVAIELNDLAWVLVRQGKLEEARKLMQDVARIAAATKPKPSVQ
jgi:tetratricopeptide (TPR) repeat protein